MTGERLTDVLDRASEIEMRTTAGLIAELQGRCRPEQKPGADGEYAVVDCIECGNEIGTKRLKVSIKNLHCVFCAAAAEKRNGRR